MAGTHGCTTEMATIPERMHGWIYMDTGTHTCTNVYMLVSTAMLVRSTGVHVTPGCSRISNHHR